MTGTQKKIWIFAGEASGDTYGAQLAGSIRKLEEQAGNEIEIAGMGGAKMRDAGVDIMIDSSELGVMGIVEVLKILFTIIRVFYFLKNKAVQERPDAVILIDYPGFNLRFAKAMHKHGIPVIWYVSPHVWTWAKSACTSWTNIAKKCWSFSLLKRKFTQKSALIRNSSAIRWWTS